MAKRSLTTVNSILNTVVRDLGLDKRLREHTFMSLWPTFVSSALAQRSRPLFFDSQRNLVISVADAATGQELSMLKGKLAPALQHAARSIGVELTGLRLDMKHFHGQSMMPAAPEQPKPIRASQADLDKITLTSSDRRQLEDMSTQLQSSSLSVEQQAKILMLFEKQLRLRQFRLKHGFPVCQQCGEPVERLHRVLSAGTTDPLRLCLTCVYAS